MQGTQVEGNARAGSEDWIMNCSMAVCNVHMEKPAKWKSEARIAQLKRLHESMIGKTKENHAGVALRAQKLSGRNKYNDASKASTSRKLMGRPNPRKGLTKDNCECFAKVSEWRKGKTKENTPFVARQAESRRGKNKYNTPSIAKMAEQRRGKTKEDTPYVARQSATLTGRNKHNDLRVAAMAEKLTGRTKKEYKYLERLSETLKKQVGSKNPNWIDGRSYFPYPFEFNVHTKQRIKERDGYVCQVCGISEEKHRSLNKNRGLAIHNINYDKTYNDDINMVTTCLPCNNRANSNREFWQRFFTDKLLIKSNSILVYG